jgi:hypothetical protein
VGERECSILILSVEHKESNSAFPRPTPPTSKPAKKHTSFYQCVGSILCKNRREREVLERFESQGFKALKKGWPDFLFYKDGEIVMVEVKKKQRRRTEKMGLSTHQQEMRRILSQYFTYHVEYVE